jgi:hypothetical protein
MTRSRPGWPQLRTQVLAGVLLITLVALAAFDVAAMSALRRYLLSRTDSNLAAVVNLYRPAVPPSWLSPRHQKVTVPRGQRKHRPGDS